MQIGGHVNPDYSHHGPKTKMFQVVLLIEKDIEQSSVTFTKYNSSSKHLLIFNNQFNNKRLLIMDYYG